MVQQKSNDSEIFEYFKHIHGIQNNDEYKWRVIETLNEIKKQKIKPNEKGNGTIREINPDIVFQFN
jgi:hypothetical protein